MQVTKIKMAVIVGSLFVITSALSFSSLSSAEPQQTSAPTPTETPRRELQPQVHPTPYPTRSSDQNAMSKPVSPISMRSAVGEAHWQRLMDSGFDPGSVTETDSRFCISKFNLDGLLEEKECFDSVKGSSITQQIDYAPRFNGPIEIVDQLQRTTTEKLNRYGIFDYGDSYCYSRDFSFYCYLPETGEFFTQTWKRDSDGSKTYGEPVPFVPQG